MPPCLESTAPWERVARAVVLVSVLAAVAFQHLLWLSRAELPAWLALDALIVAVALLARARPGAALFLVLGGSAVLHGRLLAYLGLHSMAQLQPAMMGLLAIALARGPRLSWCLPGRWRAPLIFWALVVGLSWPVVVLRELDFAPLLTLGGTVATVNNGFGVRAVDAAGWVVQTAVVQLAGIIWLDSLFRRSAQSDREQVVRRAMWPLAAGMAAAFAVACWQAYVDIRFLNFDHWSQARRATGTLLDGNALGICAALMGPLLFVLARAGAPPGAVPVRALVPLGVATLTVLLSGSTSALVIVVPGLAALAWSLVQERRQAGQALPWRGLASLAATAVIALALSVPAGESSLERLARFVPQSDEVTPRTVVSAQLRDRPFFARLGLTMAAEWPVAGIGVGSFHTLANDVAVAHDMTGWVEFENALNWYVHQLAELGVLGSAGWIAWLLVLAPTLLHRLRSPASVVPSVVLLGFGAASLFGVHAQNSEVLVLFWALAFWLAPDTDGSGNRLRSPAGPAARRRIGVAVLGLALAYTALQGVSSAGSLRLERRAAMAGWSYEVGFHDWEESDRLGPFRWTGRRARALLAVEDRWLELALAAFRPGLAGRPLRVDILVDGQIARTVSLDSQEPVRAWIAMPADRRRIRLEIRAAEVWRPARDGLADGRALGVAVGRWRFVPVAEPATGAGEL